MVANWVDVLLHLVEIVLVIAIGLFIKSYLPSYFKKKGENLATKEDVEDITDKIERVRSQYASDIEALRSELGRQAHMHRLRFEREFDILSEVWSTLSDLRMATLSLRPPLDHLDETKSEDMIKHERLQRFGESYQTFLEVVDKNRPFYPQQIYDALMEVMGIARVEAAEYSYFSPVPGGFPGSSIADYWRKATENAEAVTTAVDSVCDAIRERIAA